MTRRPLLRVSAFLGRRNNYLLTAAWVAFIAWNVAVLPRWIGF